MERRAFLGVIAAALGGMAMPAEASAEPSRAGRSLAKVRSVDASAHGVTLDLRLEHAPFDERSAEHQDPTVLVFVPAHLRVGKDGRVDFVVHFHGHSTTARRAIGAHRLREQLRESRQNAVLVVPQGPVNAANGDFGRLMTRGGLARLLDEVRAVAKVPRVSQALGKSSLAPAERTGRVILSAHSGGYRAAAACIARGGVDAREVYLFDALYGESKAFREYVLAAPRTHKLVSYSVGGAPRTNSAALANELRARDIRVESELDGGRVTRVELTKGRAVFLAGNVAHGAATYEEHALRDCLFASCLKGRGSEAWHAANAQPRAT